MLFPEAENGETLLKLTNTYFSLITEKVYSELSLKMKDGSYSTRCLKFLVFGVSILVQADMSHGSRSNFCVNEANVQVLQLVLMGTSLH